MRDRGLIYAGLFVFLGLVTYPISYDLAGRKSARGPDLALPSQARQCVAPREYMRGSHMNLLLAWRDGVVRKNNRQFVAFDGKVYTVSLSGTCLAQCHTSKAAFCDRCHSYVGVAAPRCMDCHVDPNPEGSER